MEGLAIKRCVEENGVLEDLNKQVLILKDLVEKYKIENQQLKNELLELYRRTHQYSGD